jgi:hypothetical protein
MRARITILIAGILLVSPVALAQVPIPVPTARAFAFHDELFWIWLIEQAVMLAVPATLLFTGWGGGIRGTLRVAGPEPDMDYDAAVRNSGRRALRAGQYGDRVDPRNPPRTLR